MANSEREDLMSIGSHCSVASCGQIDFLPFECDCCRRTFCLEHRTYEAHACPNADGRTQQTFVCPLCARAVKLSPGQDANEAFDAHRAGGCDPDNYARVHKKKKCPVNGCREKLTTVNKFQCKSCGVEVCMSHRLPDDHDCEQRQAEMKKTVNRKWNLFEPSGSQNRQAPNSRNAGQSGSSAPSSKQPQKLLVTLPSFFKQVPKRQQQSKTEVCQQCGARFSSVQQLIRHSEEYHSADSANSRNDMCPRCGQHFHDAVALVDHVENRRCGSKKSTCVLC